MADDREKKSTPQGKTAPSPEPPAGGQPKIIWDSSNMRSVYANVFNVAGAREEFVLFFGMNQAWDAGLQALKVQLTDRVVMSPFAAKRLYTLFGNVIRDYEKRYGVLDVETTRPDTASVQ